MTSPVTRLCGAVVLAITLTACSGDDGNGRPGRPAASPTAVGDASLVRVLAAGGEPRRVLRLSAEQGSRTSAELELDQEVERDGQVTDAPPVTFPFDTEVSEVSDDEITTSQTYAAVAVDGPAGREIAETLAPVAGATGTLTLRTDGTTVATTVDLADDAPGAAALTAVRNQVRALTPVFPTDEVGAGATWTVTSVVDVDGATVDQTATYTLSSIDGDAYVVGVTVAQEFRAGRVSDLVLTRGGGSLSARLEGDLATPLPTRATADATSTVSYRVDDAVTQVRTSIRGRLSSG